jgi:hypothetical protein
MVGRTAIQCVGWIARGAGWLVLGGLIVAVGTMSGLFPALAKWLAIGVVSAGTVYLAARSPFQAFLVFLATLPLEAAFVLEVGFTVRPAYLVLLLVLFVTFMSRERYGSSNSPLCTPILLYLSVCAASMVMTYVVPIPEVQLSEMTRLRGSAVRSCFQFSLLVLFAASHFVTIYYCSDRRRLLLAVRVYLAVVVIISAYALYQVVGTAWGLPFVHITNAVSTNGLGFGGPFKGTSDVSIFRPFATFQEPLHLGHFLLSALPLLLVLNVYRAKVRLLDRHLAMAYASTPIVLMGIGALFVTRARGAWAGFLVAVALMLMMVRSRNRLRIIAVVLVVIVIAAFVFDVSNLTFLRLDKGRMARDPRWPSMLFAVRFWSEHPVIWPLGVGVGNYGLHSAAALGRITLGTADNFPLQCLVETGCLGLGAMLYLLSTYFRYMLRALRRFRATPWFPVILGYFLTHVAMAVHLLVGGDRLALYFWVSLGMAVCVVQWAEKDQQGEIPPSGEDGLTVGQEPLDGLRGAGLGP